jgi:hypothetical protein
MPYKQSAKQSAKQGLRDSVAKAKIRVLLGLWDLDATKNSVKKGEVIKWVKNSNERSGDYKPVLQELAAKGAIALQNNQISLTDRGLGMLDESLTSAELSLGEGESGPFEFPGSIIGTKVANALLKWIRDRANLSTVAASTTTRDATQPATTKKSQAKSTKSEGAIPRSGSLPGIASYEQFTKVVLEVYDQLNRDYNYEHLVPIYHLRREIGDRLSRSQFNNWLIEMQANDIVQLMAGEMPDMTPDKREDSLVIPDVGLRYYAKRIDREDN